MPFSATVLNVLIASPPDVPGERQAISEVLYEWNALHAQETGRVKDRLSAAGGKWIKTKPNGAFAWMFSKKRLAEIADIFGLPATLVN